MRAVTIMMRVLMSMNEVENAEKDIETMTRMKLRMALSKRT